MSEAYIYSLEHPTELEGKKMHLIVTQIGFPLKNSDG
jgi:hypothetical protein